MNGKRLGSGLNGLYYCKKEPRTSSFSAKQSEFTCRLDVFDGVETDEYDEREICVERVGDEKGNEADRPG